MNTNIQNTMYYNVKTQNFTFVLKVQDFPTPVPKRMFFVGDSKGPCLEASVFMPNANPVFKPHECILHQIDVLKECVLQGDVEKASFGTELLYAFINILKSNCPHITQIALTDSSNIPCIRHKDMLDLLSYNIALYGKSWYEMKAGALLSSPAKQSIYETEILNYINPNTKNKFAFDDLFRVVIQHNRFATAHIENNKPHYMKMYESTNTFPEFFKTLKSEIDKQDICKFFKEWMFVWVKQFVHIERDWVIPILINDTLGNILNTSKQRPAPRYTRKISNSSKNKHLQRYTRKQKFANAYNIQKA